MKRKNATRSALFTSVISLLLCVSMLVGTTFAWFTDSVTSGNNQIIAGNLDIDVMYANTPDGTYTSIETVEDLFVAPSGGTKGLWEPGHTEVAYLKVVNNGTLALKYQFKVDAASEVIGKSVLGNDIKLSEILKFVATEPSDAAPAAYTRATAQAAAEASDSNLLGYTTDVIALAPGAAQYIALVVYMPETTGNEANYRGDAVPSINFSLTALATQVEAENDSFDNTYDKNAWTEVAEVPTPDENGVVNIYTAEQLAGVMANTTGIKTINIVEDIDLAGRAWAPAYVSAPDLVINGNGHTISNMTTNSDGYQGFIGVAYQNLTINDLTFKNAKVNANKSFDGTVIGWAWGNADITFNNVDVIDSEVSATLDNKCIRVGGLIGFFPYDGGNLTLKDCDVTGSTISGYHNVGAMVGTTLTQKTVTIENCTAKNNTLKYGSPNVGAFDFGAYDSGYSAYVPASGFTAENNKLFAVVSSTDSLDTAIQAGKTEIELTAGTYVVPAAVSGKTVTIVGNGETVIDITTVPTYAGLPGATITFENVIIKSDAQGAGYNRGFAHTNKITYNNCVINGTLGLNTDTEFNNCAFNISGDYYNLWTWGAENVAFNGCTFNSDGKAVLLYGTANTKLTVNNCVFNDNGGLTDLKAAIEIGNDYNKSYELIVTNTTVNGYEINDKGINTGSTLWANKNSMGTDKLNVVIDGVDVY